ncbi:hypothetical protein [Brevundimonas sp.]|uniref:hypothetical protein n=1 Tax=Brevundimonas sp. TaxID=1871086 RepID=UPI0028966581|nr:hypothetical protein [Brevundimonas sp.]
MSRLLDPENFVAEKLAWHQRIASDPRVSLSAKAVAGFILHDLNASEGGAWRGQESMAASLGVSTRQLRRLLEELEAASYLQVEVRKGRGRTNICRATLPSEAAGASENRTPTAAQAVEKRTSTAVQMSKNRTSASRKPDMDDRRILYDSIRRFPAPEGRRSGSANRPLAKVDPFAEADIRATVIRLAGEEATVSYLDPAAWDADNNRIVCASSTGFARLRDLVERPLAAKGVSIALELSDAGRMAA